MHVNEDLVFRLEESGFWEHLFPAFKSQGIIFGLNVVFPSRSSAFLAGSIHEPHTGETSSELTLISDHT